MRGEMLRRLREGRGETLADVAKSADCGSNYVGMVERGERVGSIRFWSLIARHFGVPLDIFSEPARPARAAKG